MCSFWIYILSLNCDSRVFWIYTKHFEICTQYWPMYLFVSLNSPNWDLGRHVVQVPRPHTIRHNAHPVRLLWTSDQPVAVAPTYTTHNKYRMTQKKGAFEKPNKNWRNPKKKFIDRNWTITTCLLRDSNPNYQCLKITSCRLRPPPRMHSCVACSTECDSVTFCRACNTHRVTQKDGNFWNA